MTLYHLELAGLEDLLRIWTDVDWAVLDTRPDVHSSIPPPGFDLIYHPRVESTTTPLPLPFIEGGVDGNENTLTAGDLYWTTLGQYGTHLSAAKYASLLAKVLAAASVLPGGWADPLAYPIVYHVGKVATMRWIRNTYRGSLSGGVEQFQYKIDLGDPGNDPDLDDSELEVLAEQLGGIFYGLSQGIKGAVSTEHQWTEVGCVIMTATAATDAQGNGGNMAQQGQTQWYGYPLATAPVGQSGGVTLPLEVAMAVTLQSDQRGPSGRGRFYLPPCGVNGISAGGVYGQARDFALQGTHDWLTAIKANTPYVPVVVSPRRLYLHEVTSINVGSVPDSQRRRRRSQIEARVPMAI